MPFESISEITSRVSDCSDAALSNFHPSIMHDASCPTIVVSRGDVMGATGA